MGRKSHALDYFLIASRDNERMTKDVVSQSGETVLVAKSAKRYRIHVCDDP